MRYGLKEETIEKISRVFFKYPKIEKVLLYGSRAKGNYKNGSDIDLTIFGDGIDLKVFSEIADEIEDLMLPYMIDLCIYSDIENSELREHIERVGTVFYDRDKYLNTVV